MRTPPHDFDPAAHEFVVVDEVPSGSTGRCDWCGHPAEKHRAANDQSRPTVPSPHSEESVLPEPPPIGPPRPSVAIDDLLGDGEHSPAPRPRRRK